MHKLRLTVCCPDEPTRAGIASRLSRAGVETRANLSDIQAARGDAVVLAGCPDRATIDRLLATGVHVLLAANSSMAADGLGALYHTAQSARVQFVLANPDRSLPSRQLIRQQLSGPLGEPALIRLHRWQSAGRPPDLLHRDLDVMLWLAGRRPDRVFALQQTAEATGRYVQLHLGFPGGCMALFDYTDRLPPGDGYQSLSVIATNGAAYADDHQNTQLLYTDGHPRAIRTEERSQQLAVMAQEFVDGLLAGRDMMTANAAAWQEVSVVADAMRRSLASGQAVTPGDR